MKPKIWLLIFACILIMAACKKDKNNSDKRKSYLKSWNNKYRTAKYDYDESGRLIRVEQTMTATIITEYSDFNEQGAPKKAINYTKDRPDNRTTQLAEYDDKGRITKLSNYTSTNLLSTYSNYTYADKVMEVASYTNTGVLRNRVVYNYNDKGNLTRAAYYNYLNSLIEIFDYFDFDNQPYFLQSLSPMDELKMVTNGNYRRLEVSKPPSTEKTNYQYIHEYNADGLVVKTTSKKLNPPPDEIASETVDIFEYEKR